MIKAMALSNPHTKSQESDTDTETPLQTHLSRALSLTNGSFHNSDNQPTPPPPPPPPPPHVTVVSYKECLKNHAASLGGLALDGCGEFLPSPTANLLDPTSLKCAACGCHRNFHRRDPHSSPLRVSHLPPPVLQWTSSPSPGQTSSGPSPSPTSPASPTPQQSVYPSAPHMLLALSTGHSGPIDENQYHNPMAMNPHGRKRARTKFSEEQKEKMCVFAEKLGWKMLRGNDDKLVEDFCSEVGVKRSVFKVWMHNNKHRKENGNGHNCDINTKIINNTNGNEGKGVAFDSYKCDSHNNSINSFDRYPTETKVRVHGSSPDGSFPSS